MKLLINILIAIVAICFIQSAVAQKRYKNLDKLPQPKRDSVLMAIAKEAIMTYGPGYYREYNITTKKDLYTDQFKKAHNVYVVTCYYDKTIERLNMDYAAEIIVYENSGEAFLVRFGNGLGIGGIDKTQKKGRSTNHRVIQYQNIKENGEGGF